MKLLFAPILHFAALQSLPIDKVFVLEDQAHDTGCNGGEPLQLYLCLLDGAPVLDRHAEARFRMPWREPDVEVDGSLLLLALLLLLRAFIV